MKKKAEENLCGSRMWYCRKNRKLVVPGTADFAGTRHIASPGPVQYTAGAALERGT